MSTRVMSARKTRPSKRKQKSWRIYGNQYTCLSWRQAAIIFQELAAQRTCHPTKRLYENVLFELHVANFLWV